MLLQSLISQLPPFAARATGSSPLPPPLTWTRNSGSMTHSNINNSNNSSNADNNRPVNGNLPLLELLYFERQRANLLQQELPEGLRQLNSQD
jgi:hypothetical protein